MTEKHYSYGSGSPGCMYDYGPHFSEDIEGAIDDLLFVFQDILQNGEEDRMRGKLRSVGYHQFENPLGAGAYYCEIVEQAGPCPEIED